MSLILEALKRSEAERRLGEAPDLLAPPPEFVGPAPRHAVPRVFVVAAIGLLLVGVGGAAWWFGSRGSEREARVVAVREAAPTATATPPRPLRPAPALDGIPSLLGVAAPAQSEAHAPAPATQPMPPDPTAPLLPPDTVVGRSPVPVEPQSAPIPSTPTPDPAVTSTAGPLPSTDGSAPPVAPAASPDTTPPAVVATEPAALPAPEPAAPPPPEVLEESPASDLPDLSALPLAVRQSLPPLVLNMHLYRAAPSERVVILDGKRLHEGESAGDLEVAEIRSDGVVLVAKGQRFLLSRLPR